MSENRKFNLKQFIRNHLTHGAVKMDYDIADLMQLMKLAKLSFLKQTTLVDVGVPVTVCGDIHGQYRDLFRIFQGCGLPHITRYLFLGDYVDRGSHSLEVITLLMSLKTQFPNGVFLLRGNHETKQINTSYGFRTELCERFAPEEAMELHNAFNEVFDCMPVAALIVKRILCMHGGLSPHLKQLKDIRDLPRPMPEPDRLAIDLMWSDPDVRAKGYEQNPVRGISYIFGEAEVKKALADLKIDMVIRAHQVVEDGYAFFASRKLITIFSAPRYHEDLENSGAAIIVNRELQLKIFQMKPIEKHYPKMKEAKEGGGTEDDGSDERHSN